MESLHQGAAPHDPKVAAHFNVIEPSLKFVLSQSNGTSQLGTRRLTASLTPLDRTPCNTCELSLPACE